MQIHTDLAQFPILNHAIVTSGTFDGVHLGHQTILNRLKMYAQEQRGQTVIITYHPHPRLVLFPNENLKLLNTLEEKIQYLENLGIEHLLIIPFTAEFAQLSSQAFIQKVLIEAVHTKKLVIGFDHRFGKGREGSFEYLKAHEREYPFVIEEIPRQDIENEKISSTRIRQALAEGRVKEANIYLGKPYALQGVVIKGDQIGRTIGFPTANLQLTDKHKLIPKEGVYAALAQLPNSPNLYETMLYIGYRPVLHQPPELRIEANLLDFDQDIYNQTLHLQMIDFVRPDAFFANLEALRQQIEQDKQQIKKMLAKI